MTQENKNLLIKDLCARLPYEVKVHAKYIDTDANVEVEKDGVLSMVDNDVVIEFTSDDTNCYNYVAIHEVKPYLYPMSSITDEQIMQSPISVHVCDLENLRYDSVWTELNSRFTDLIDLIDWLNKNHFDYRGLIGKGLAIDATGLNIY